MNKQRSLLAGALEACIKPVRIAQIVKEYNLESGMVFGKFHKNDLNIKKNLIIKLF